LIGWRCRLLENTAGVVGVLALTSELAAAATSTLFERAGESLFQTLSDSWTLQSLGAIRSRLIENERQRVGTGEQWNW